MSCTFDSMKGKLITDISGMEEGSEEIMFTFEDGSKYRMCHYQDCCETVRVVDVVGDVQDLIGSEVLIAEEAVNDPPDGVVFSEEPGDYYDSRTWTFYKLATRKGFVDIRWLGESNGYYSESVDFEKVV